MKRYFCYILLSSIALQLFGKNGMTELRERVYVQTDKHLYLAGEPILLKLLTTDAELIPITFSKIAYVELANDTIAQLQIKVELTNGTGSGRMLLPADLTTGYYRLIAYTQYMRNEGVDIFFEKNIAVLNTFQSGYQPAETEPMEMEHHSTSAVESSVGTISLQPDKTTYTTRTRGELILGGLPENIHTLSVSIAGKEFIPVAESNVSLFQKNMTKKANAFSGNFLPEYEGHIVTGKIIDNQTGEMGVDEGFLTAGIAFHTGDGIRFFLGQKSGRGDVRFFTSAVSGTKEIATVVYNTEEKYRLDIQSSFITRYAPKQMSALHIDSAYYGQLLARSVALQVFRYFLGNSFENQNVPEPHFKMEPTWSYLLDEYTRFTTMREVFIEFITGARFRSDAGKQKLQVLAERGNRLEYGTMPLVLLDGVPVADHDAIFNYNPLFVKQINIYYGPFIMGGYPFDGIVELFTYRRLHQDLNLNSSTQILAYEGPQLPYRFDAPDYSNEKNRNSRIPDTRHTLLWNPDVKTDGKISIRLPFDTSNLQGEFQATVEGITKDGEIIFATSFFKVH